MYHIRHVSPNTTSVLSVHTISLSIVFLVLPSLPVCSILFSRISTMFFRLYGFSLPRFKLRKEGGVKKN